MRKGHRPTAVRVTDSPKAVFLPALIAAICLTLVFFASGCRKPAAKPSAARIHAITQQLAAEAAASGATVRIKKAAADNDASSRDEVDVRLPAGSSLNDTKAITALLQRIENVATRSGLTQDEATHDGNAMKVTLRRSGVVTHEITIESGDARNARTDGTAKLAIILDDLGSDRAAAEAIFAMPYKLTVSVLPDQPHSEEIAQEAHRRGFEVMLHLPMESVGKERPEVQELHPGMPESRVVILVADFLARVPYATGVNNHQGSQATSDPQLMNDLMPILRAKKLFYIDSRTTAATVAYDAAQRAGVPSAFRNVPFLDDVEEVGAVRKQLELAFRGAKEKGEAIAIGHPHAATREALAEILPRAQKEGIELVQASELVH